jgi:hypothetical protein
MALSTMSLSIMRYLQTGTQPTDLKDKRAVGQLLHRGYVKRDGNGAYSLTGKGSDALAESVTK